MESERDELEAAAIEAELASLETILGGREGAAEEADPPTEEAAAAGSQVAETAEEAGDDGQDRLTMAGDVSLDLDDMRVAERVAVLSEAVAKAGITDVLEGAEMLVASDDVAVQSAVIGLLAEEDLVESMDVAAISGQLFAVSEMLAAIDMPVLAAFLEEKGEELHDIAVDSIFRYSAARALGEAMADTGADIGAMGRREMAEGAAGLQAAGEFAELGDDLATEGQTPAAQDQGDTIEEANEDGDRPEAPADDPPQEIQS